MPEILDAPLTNKGREQAFLLQPTVRAMKNKPELIVLSPNCRALATGSIAFEEFIGTIPFVAHEMVREETGVHVCDKRRPKSRQEKEFPMIDFSLLETDEDIIWSEHQRETKIDVAKRIYNFLDWLECRQEKHVGVSSHSAWLLTTFNANLDVDDERLTDWFQTGEMRSAILEFIRRD
jgi:broad specificity phosphatase PhoE